MLSRYLKKKEKIHKHFNVILTNINNFFNLLSNKIKIQKWSLLINCNKRKNKIKKR
jgi:hypothetical protein